MATLSKPLISAAALAGAAAVAVATPAILPSVGVPTPGALSRAAYELTTFSDVLSIPPVVWTDILFGNQEWGNTLSATTYGPAWAQPTDQFGQPAYINPWAAFCNGRCSQVGIPGVMYVFSDALVNGNGNGYADYNNWPIGIVNYFFEPATAALLGGGSSPTVQYSQNGFSAATWYALAGTIGQQVPSLQVPLAAAFWGPNNVTVGYNLALTLVAQAAQAVPVIGPVTGNSILAYLGDLEVPGAPGTYYQYGLSGALNYWIDIATGAVPFPTGTTTAAATAASVAAPVRGAVEAPAVEADAAASVTPDTTAVIAATPVKPDTTAVIASTPVADAPEVTPAADLTADAPKAPENTPAADVVDSTPAADIEVDVPEAPESTPADVTADAPEAPESNAADAVMADLAEAKDAPAADAADNAAADSTPSGSSAKAGEEVAAKADSSASAGSETSDAGADKADAAKSDSAGGDSAGSAS
jgi:hypothetical protein